MKYIIGDILEYKGKKWKVTMSDSSKGGRYSLLNLEDGSSLGNKRWKVEKSAKLIEAAPRADNRSWWKKILGMS